MSFRPFILGIVALAAVFFLGKTFAQAQVPPDVAAWKDPQNAEAVPEWARRLLNSLNSRDFREIASTSRGELLTKTLSALKEIAADSHVVPSTRINAILTAGQLVSGEPGNPLVAYPDALPYLIEVYQQPDTPHYLQCGALLGIVRHANNGIDPARKDEVIDLLLETVITEFGSEGNPLDPAPLEPEAWDWFRHAALDGLAGLTTVGTNGKVVAELLGVINYKSQELENLCRNQEMFTRREWEQSRRAAELASKAAKTLGDLNYSSVTDLDAANMTDTFIRLTRAICDINSKMAADSIEKGGTSPNPTLLLEQIVINVKMGTQSVVWGIRSSFLVSRSANDSFYTSLESNDPTVKRLDMLLAEIMKLAAFLDEGDGTRRPILSANLPREFQFNLSELRDALAKTSEAFTEKQYEEEIEDEVHSPVEPAIIPAKAGT